MGNYIDLTGQQFTRLYVDSRAPTTIKNKTYETWYNCICSCGNRVTVRSRHLRSCAVKSCGCLEKENLYKISHAHTHSESKTRLYSIWTNIIDRCSNKNNPSFKNYGGRGITICDSWRKYENFRDWALEHEYTDDLSIDRINNCGNYEPENCRWTTSIQQANNKRNNRIFNNKTIAQLSREYSIPYKTLYYRLVVQKWDFQKAVSLSVTDSKKIPNKQILISYKGKTQNLTAWAKEYNLSLSGLRKRLSKGLSLEEALKKPKRNKGYE